MITIFENIFTKRMITNIILYFFAVNFTALGISLIVYSNSGMGVWDAFTMGLSRYLNFTFGRTMILVGAGIFLVTSILDKKLLPVMSIITVFIVGTLVDIWGLHVFTNTIAKNYSIYFVGVIIFSFGLALNIASKIQPAPYEQLPLTITKITKKNYKIVRITTDLLVVLMAFIISIPFNDFSQFGIGTIFSAILVGPLLAFSLTVINKCQDKNTIHI